MRNGYFLVILIGTLFLCNIPTYAQDQTSYALSNCNIKVLTKASCDKTGLVCVGLTTIGGCTQSKD